METIDDIVREMRERAAEIRSNGLNDEFSANVETLFEMDADRIEAAAKFVTSVAERSDRELAVLAAENADLRAALKAIRDGETMFDYASPNKIAELALNESEAK